MPTRRDQLQAYRFAQARVHSALLAGDPDQLEQPLRRTGVATFAGVMVAVLVACGFGIFGLISPGSKKGWDSPGTLVVEKETGARFVYDARDGALHPVLNYASARLILGQPEVAVREFSRASLNGVPRGAPRGVAGLPDALPSPGGLVRGPWVVCSTAPVGGVPSLSVSVGFAPSGRHVTGPAGLLVRSPDGSTYLVWNDTRLLVPPTSPALQSLGLDGKAPIPVSSTWVNSVQPGPDLKAPVPAPVGVSTDYRNGDEAVFTGQVFKVDLQALEPSYYLALKTGIARISPVVANLLLGDPETRYAYGGPKAKAPAPKPMDPAVANALPHLDAGIGAGLPQEVPQLVDAPVDADGQPVPASVCAAYSDTTGAGLASSVYVGDRVPGVPGGPSRTPSAAGQQVRLVLPPGAASLARPLVRPGQPSDATFLVTELGAKYAVPPGGAAAALGYGSVAPVPVPKGILDLVPSGPVLDAAQVNADLSPAVAPSPSP